MPARPKPETGRTRARTSGVEAERQNGHGKSGPEPATLQNNVPVRLVASSGKERARGRGRARLNCPCLFVWLCPLWGLSVPGMVCRRAFACLFIPLPSDRDRSPAQRTHLSRRSRQQGGGGAPRARHEAAQRPQPPSPGRPNRGGARAARIAARLKRPRFRTVRDGSERRTGGGGRAAGSN